nr:hypothetical protein [Ruminiclostridium papyrosolvens]
MSKMNEILKKAIETWGKDAQLDMVIEEMSELTKEICKHKRGKSNRAEIIEEIADVEIMIEQLIIMLEIDEGEIGLFKREKINRLADRLGIERTV